MELVSGILTPNEIIFKQSTPDDNDIQLGFTESKVRELLKKHSLKGDPIILINQKLDLVDGT